MRGTRSVLGVLAALVLAAAAMFAAGSAAQAAGRSTGGTVMHLPVPTRVAPRSAEAVAPDISPAVTTTHLAYGSSILCPSGDLCTAVQDPTTNSWKIFFLYICTTYSVSGWNGDGDYADSQTSGTSYFYDSAYNELTHFTPDGGIDHTFGWDPVWHIKNC
ncbi:hypothetical protein [Streptomyces sp. NPDC086777]|uniref:hypothetical protein n=1 Tax=Streptomyces sp. NPDC086777 TaxID=3154866 RepID=UPI00344E99AB